MLKAFKYRIYPTKTQRSKMERTLELCRWTYNETLAYRKNSFEQEGKSISKYDGLKVPKSLSDRVHGCPQCGLVMDRDENAAINILRLGLQSLPKARSPALQGGE